jgi:RES domain-containing protein
LLAWRLCRAPFADLSGEGARLYGGRWNAPGYPLLYTASSAALALLEVRVHLDLPPELLPEDYVLMTIDLGDLPVETVDVAPASPTIFGADWIKQQRTPVLQVPSSIVAECTNFLINPAHPQASAARILGQRPFAFDRRLWLPL